jgi:membrane associated rhomboid family serine protease
MGRRCGDQSREIASPVITDVRYETVIVAASSRLQALGARLLVATDLGASAPPWAAGWDRVLAEDAPGGGTIYAFTRGDGADADSLQRRVDGLASGLGQAGFSGPVPVSVVFIIVFTGPVPAALLRRAARMVPRAYVPGIRPRSAVMDMASSEVRGLRGSAARQVLEQALHAPPGGTVPDFEVEAGRQRSLTHTRQFYDLMRGRQPVVTFGLVAVNVAVFIAMLVAGGSANAGTVLHGGPMSDAVVRTWGAESPILVESGQWWRVASSMFLHASITHILFNMVSLLAIGTLAERLYGSARFLFIYLGAGLLGSITSFVLALYGGNPGVLSVGASGAIFGVAGALVTVRFQQSDVIPLQVRQRITASIAPLIVISLVLAGLTPYVDNSAHVGGLLGGMALSFAFPLTRTAPAPR